MKIIVPIIVTLATGVLFFCVKKYYDKKNKETYIYNLTTWIAYFEQKYEHYRMLEHEENVTLFRHYKRHVSLAKQNFLLNLIPYEEETIENETIDNIDINIIKNCPRFNNSIKRIDYLRAKQYEYRQKIEICFKKIEQLKL